MVPGPVFRLDVVVAARRWRMRAGHVVWALLLLATLYIHYSNWSQEGTVVVRDAGRFAAAFFYTALVLQLLAVAALAPIWTSGTIARARQCRTLDYLLASDLSNGEIVLGSLGPQLLKGMYLLLAGAPVLSIASLLGGIAPEVIALATLLSLSTLCLTGCIGIAVSVRAARASDALVRTYVILAGLLIIPSGLLQVFRYRWPSCPLTVLQVIEWLDALNSLGALRTLIYADVRTAVGSPWQPTGTTVAAQLALAALCIGFTVPVVRAVQRHRYDSPGRLTRLLRWRPWRWPRPAIGGRPMAWKEALVDRPGDRLGVVSLVLQCTLLAAPLVLMSDQLIELSWRREWKTISAILLGAAAVLGWLAMMAIGVRAAGSVTAEKEADTWLTLLTTPLSAAEIVDGKLLGAVRSAVVLLGAWALMLVGCCLLYVDHLLAAVVEAVTCVVLWGAAAALGVRISIQANSTLRSIAVTVAVLLFFSGGYLFCCAPMLHGDGAGLFILMSWVAPFLLYFANSMLSDTVVASSLPEETVAAYLIGLGSYLAAWLLLRGDMVARFDEICGRTRPRSNEGHAHRTQSPAIG